MTTHSKTVANKKGNKMTKLYVRGNVIWLNYYVDGVRKQKSTKLRNTPENIKAVTSKIIPSLDIKIATGEIYKKKPKTFEYYGSIFLKQKEVNRSFSVKRDYYERVINRFKGRDISLITRLDVKRYLLGLEIQPQSVKVYRACVREIFGLAIDDNIISHNPAANIKLKGQGTKEIQYYKQEEVRKILSVAKGVMKPYLEIAFNTGLRVGEILGLQLGDFQDGFINIRRTRTKGIIGSGKTWNAQRKVPHPKFLLAEVKKLQKDNIFLFGDIDDAYKLTKKWTKVIKDSGLVRKKLSSTRHTYATLMLKNRIVSPSELAGLLGHSKASTTLEYYASVIKSDTIDLGSDFCLFGDVTGTIENKESSKAL